MFDYFEHHSDGKNLSNDREGRDFFFLLFLFELYRDVEK